MVRQVCKKMGLVGYRLSQWIGSKRRLSTLLGAGLAVFFFFVYGMGVPHQVVQAAEDETKTVEESLTEGSLVNGEELHEETELNAPNTQEEAPITTGPSLHIGSYVLNMLGALALIVGLLYLLYRLLAKRSLGFVQGNMFRSLGGYALGPQKSIQLVEIGEKIYVLGVAEEVTLLRVIEDPDEVRELTRVQESGRQANKEPAFHALLAGKLQQLKENRSEWLTLLQSPGDVNSVSGSLEKNCNDAGVHLQHRRERSSEFEQLRQKSGRPHWSKK